MESEKNWKNISDDISEVTKKIKDKVNDEDLVEDLKDSLKQTIDNTSEVLSSLMETINSTIKDEEIRKDAKDIIEKVNTEVASALKLFLPAEVIDIETVEELSEEE